MSSNRLLCESRGASRQSYIYEQEGFVPVATIDQDQNIRYYHTDHLGTPQELTNTEGEIVWEAEYVTWGNTVKVDYKQKQSIIEEHNEVALQPLRFQGQYYDQETGLHYNRFRYYDPDVGRFTTKDPIGLLGGDNLYVYAPNPMGWVDPLGLSCKLGRSGKQARLKELLNDPKLGKADRGWIQQEINQIKRGKRKNIRLPGSSKIRTQNGISYGGNSGKELAHKRGYEAAKGYGYEHANLQDKDLHKLQHRYDDKGRKNKDRGKLDDCP